MASVHGRLEESFWKLACRVSKPYVAVVVALVQHNMFNTTTSISGKLLAHYMLVRQNISQVS